MHRVTKLFLWTLLVSFLGSLPLGTLNVSITSLTLSGGGMAAFAFGLGAIIVELLLVRMAVACIERLERMKHYLAFFHWIAAAVLLCFAAVSIIAALQMKKFGTSLRFTNSNPFAAGILLSLLNPLHLPFWLSWTAAIKSKGWLHSSASEYNVFVSAIGVGTSLAFLLYGWIGRVLILLLEDKQFLLNWGVGLTLLLTAFFQIKKICKRTVKAVAVNIQHKR